MLASTVQFSNNNQPPPRPPRQTHHPPRDDGGTRPGRPWNPGQHPEETTPPPRPNNRGMGSAPSGPNSVPTTGPLTCHHVPHPETGVVLAAPGAGRPNWSAFHPRAPSRTPAATPDTGRPSRSAHGSAPTNTLSAGEMLLRKEVIQPHLPVRLPCYDFVPIADPAFDGSLPHGVGPPASGVTDFRDVTGGVYKARERIHRSVADLRLLATPTSWGRVADPNPN